MTARPDAGTGRDTRDHVAAGRHASTTNDQHQGGPVKHTFSADEVRALLYAAYVHGRHQADVNELHATWAEKREPRLTREQRVAARLDEMDRAARHRAAREGRPYRIHPGGPVDWETGRPVGHLEVAA